MTKTRTKTQVSKHTAKQRKRQKPSRAIHSPDLPMLSERLDIALSFRATRASSIPLDLGALLKMLGNIVMNLFRLLVPLVLWAHMLSAAPPPDQSPIAGFVISTNVSAVLMWADDGLRAIPREDAAKIESLSEPPISARKELRIPPIEIILRQLAKEPWAVSLMQIPATVIDHGVLKNVPYVSFRCGEAFEMNVYGDLDAPAGFEIGAYGAHKVDSLTKSRCERFVAGVLKNLSDRSLLSTITWEQDAQSRQGMTIEVTPPTAPDAYGGWWLSVYLTNELELARIPAQELDLVTINSNSETNANDWAMQELRMARTARPKVISFKNSFGTLITNAEVVSVREGVSIDWHDSVGSGTVRLADLPEPLRQAFGYDADKARLIEANESAERSQIAIEQRRVQAGLDAAAPMPTSRPLPYYARPIQAAPAANFVGNGFGGASAGGRVYVRSYVRKDGVHVRGYTRRR